MPSYTTELFNNDPYYDDFNEDKKFLRIMFRPGFGVQARELTQIQTILQNQIERFGSHVFEEGSMVLDGKITVNSLRFARVSGLSGTNNIQDFIGSTISSSNTPRAKAKIVHAEGGYTGSSVDAFPVVFFEYIEGGTSFAKGDFLSGTGNSGVRISASVTGTSFTIPPTGNALVVSVDRGVRFTEGYFVLNDFQSVGAYSLSGPAGNQIRIYDNPTSRIGFSVNKTFVQSEDDLTLNDPAFGSYNYNAPGADRFKIDLLITQNGFTASDTSSTDNFSRKDFIEFLRIVNGVPVKIEKYPDYASLEDNMARRTYDESGNYTVRPFELSIQDGPGISNGGPTGNLFADLEPGKAYIFGYEFETQGLTRIPIDAARDTDHVRTVTDKYFNRSVGPYVRVKFSGATGSGFANIFDFKQQNLVYLGKGTSGQAQNAVGTARVRWVEPYDVGSGVYNLYLYNVEMGSTAAFTEVTRIHASATGPTSAFVVEGSNGLINIKDGNLLYKFPTGTRGKSVDDANYAIAGFFNVVPSSVPGQNFSVNTANGSSRGTINVSDYTTTTTDVAFSIPTQIITLPNNDITAFDIHGRPLGGTAARIGTSQIDLTLFGTTASTPISVVTSIDIQEITNLRRSKTVITENIGPTLGGFTTQYSGITSDIYGNNVLYLAGRVDVFDVISLTGTKDGSANQQIKQFFTFDDGQRDNIYDWSRMILRKGVSGITGPYSATIKRFERSSNRGPFTVDSYSSLNYSDIPSYVSKTTGELYDLRDTIDFRPDRGTTGVTAGVVGFPWFPVNTAANDQLFTYKHYLSRTDKIVLDRDRKFRVIKGTPTIDGQYPSDNPNAMTLYSVTVNPFTINNKDLSVRFIENKRYTMRDIGEIEKRMEAVEYYTTLSLLEQEAKAISIVDENDIEIPKKGILVDQFKGHNISDVVDPMYAASIDFENNELRPTFESRVFGVTGPIESSGVVVSPNGIITLDYTTSAEIVQPLATRSFVVNPSSVFNYLGTLELSPSNDFWFSTGLTPSVKVNVGGENDSWQEGIGFNSQWNFWESIWYGRETSNEVTTKQNLIDTKNSLVAGIRGFNLGNTFKSSVPEGIRRRTNTRVIRKDIVPYTRDNEIRLNAKGLKPNTKFYVFVDDIDITAYCTGDSQLTSPNGEVNNLRYIMDQDPRQNFLTGRRLFRITDSQSNSVTDATMGADAIFNVSGTIDTLSDDNLLSTRPAIVRRRSVKTNKIQSSLTELLSTDFFGYTEPLSQTFFVDPVKYPDGVFVKNIGVSFLSKHSDDNNTPITLMLKPTQNGYPHPSKVIPFGTKTLYPSDITTSSDGSNETQFSFSSPIYLLPGNEYAISLSTNSSQYAVFGSTIGEDIIRVEEFDPIRKATKQPSINSLFQPQNTGSITKKDTDCIKFSVYLCKFSPNSGYIKLQNKTENYGTATNFDLMRLQMNYINPSNTSISFSEKGLLSDLSSSFISTQPNKNIDRPLNISTRSKGVGKFSEIKVDMIGNAYVSPLFDAETSHYLIVGNKINNNYTLSQNNELLSTNYGATAPSESRYITKQVVLESGFEANNLHVQLSLCNPYDSRIQVFVRPLPVGEGVFGNIGYTQLTTTDSAYSQNENDFREVTYTSVGLGLSQFRAFSLKIVMYSNDQRVLPRIKNLRMVAT